jgi:hypothetical protein
MNSDIQSLYERKIRSTAKELSDNGYKVSVEPVLADLPFDLGRYCPNIIATKDNEGIVLAIKPSLKYVSVDRFQGIAEQVAAHPGWRFIVAAVDDINEKILPSAENKLPDWDELRSRLSTVNMLIEQSMFEPALLFLWNIIEAALRQRAIAQHLPIERFPASGLVDHSFSSGGLPMPDFDLFKDCLALRNKAAHGIVISINPEMLKSAYDAIQSLVIEWSADN